MKAMTTTTIRSLTASAKLGWGRSQMMSGRAPVGCIPILAAMFTAAFPPGALADVVNMDSFGVTLNNAPIFNDTFSATQALTGPAAGRNQFSGINFPDGTPANYNVMGTVTETGTKAILDTSLGAQVVQTSPFLQRIAINSAVLQTGPANSPFSLTESSPFTTSGVFGVSVPPTPSGFYQVELSDRVASNMGMGEVLSVQVHNCSPAAAACGSLTGPYLLLVDANFLTNTSVSLGVAPLDTSNQQILLELTHPIAGDPTVHGYYAYINNGVEGPLTPLGSATDLFQNLDYTQAGFVQLAPVPEPSTFTLLASAIGGLAGLGWWGRRKATGPGSSLREVTNL
jgi:hypothetical protein